MSNILSSGNEHMVKVGLTGVIGSGKTFIAGIFKILGIPVFNADIEARNLIMNDIYLKKRLAELLGDDIFAAPGHFDRQRMARIIFNDPLLLDKVNRLVHPRVREEFTGWVRRQEGSSYVLQEAAILFESGAFRLMDLNIMVTAPDELRIKRVMARDGSSREQIIARMQHQWPDDRKSGLADFIIKNDEHELLMPQILNIHNKILNYGKVR